MRVRYKFFGDEGYIARCGLSEEHARQMYEHIKKNRSCQWGELVGEDVNNFMEIIDSFTKF